MNCKNCGYRYCHFHGTDRKVLAYLCEDFKQVKTGKKVNRFSKNAPTIVLADKLKEK